MILLNILLRKQKQTLQSKIFNIILIRKRGNFVIGYLGPEYSFTYFAAASFFTKRELTSYKNIFRLFEALRNDEVVGIVVPIENSIDGSITEVLDKLVESDFHINREIVTDIQLSLISKSNKLLDIKHIISNSHALGECRITLRNKLGKYTEMTTKTVETIRIKKRIAELVLSERELELRTVATRAVIAELSALLEEPEEVENEKT